MSLRKFLIIPRLIGFRISGLRKSGIAWERYWRGIDRTGRDGHVLWDSASEAEIDDSLARMRAHMSKALPIVDIGCGNGRHTRALACQFRQAIGVDLSPSAIERARAESIDVSNSSFRVADMTTRGIGQGLRDEIGVANVFVRGVLHVLDHKSRVAMVENMRELCRGGGALYLLETNAGGNPLDLLEEMGGALPTIPDPLRLCLEAGLRPPIHFDERQHRRYFRPDRWETLWSGAAELHALPGPNSSQTKRLKAFAAVLRPRA